MSRRARDYETGKVVEVSDVPLGDELAAAALAGDSTLVLSDAVDFNEAGGTLQLGTDPSAGIHDYASADLDTDTITLLGTLGSDWDEETLVRPYPPTQGRRATVELDDEGGAIDARVPMTMLDRLPLGTRTDADSERVVLVRQDSDEYTINDVLGQEPVVDPSYTLANTAAVGTALTGVSTEPDATTTTAGKVRLATSTEVDAGSDDTIAVTPAQLANHYQRRHSAVTAVTTTPYALTAGDDGEVVEMNSASAQTLTIPTEATEPFVDGTQVRVLQVGAGTVTIAPAVGVTLNGKGYASAITTVTISSRYGEVRLRKRGTDTWVITGDFT